MKNVVIAILLILVLALSLLVWRNHQRGFQVISLTDSAGNTYSAVMQITNWRGQRKEVWQTASGDYVMTVTIETKPQ